jgi:crotonobetainyl-CoA:carnitine CoA-transferase CaiB-like acyl-CoA transferase
MIKRDNNQRLDAFAAEAALLTELMLARTADEWEVFLQARRVPAGRVREMGEALADPQQRTRGLLHRHKAVPGQHRSLTVPLAAFKFAHGGPSIETAPRPAGADTEAVLRSAGYTDGEIALFKDAKAI